MFSFEARCQAKFFGGVAKIPFSAEGVGSQKSRPTTFRGSPKRERGNGDGPQKKGTGTRARRSHDHGTPFFRVISWGAKRQNETDCGDVLTILVHLPRLELLSFTCKAGAAPLSYGRLLSIFVFVDDGGINRPPRSRRSHRRRERLFLVEKRTATSQISRFREPWSPS